MTTQPEPLAIIPKGKTRSIHVRLATFKGVTRLDIREHYRDDDTGEWLPTKSGVAMPADERVGLLVEAIRQAQEVIGKEETPHDGI